VQLKDQARFCSAFPFSCVKLALGPQLSSLDHASASAEPLIAFLMLLRGLPYEPLQLKVRLVLWTPPPGVFTTIQVLF